MKQVTQKQVQVLTIYRFRKIARICFQVESSDGSQKYNTCFNGDENHGTCGCEGFEKWHKECYHLVQLRPIAQAYFDSRRAPVQPVQKEDWTDTAQFGAQVHKMELAPSGRLVPMR